MQQLESLLAQIIEKKKRLDELRAQSPEMAEALRLSDEYHSLFAELSEMCNQPAHIVPIPYNPNPSIWRGWEITTSDHMPVQDDTATVGSRPKLRLMIDGKEISHA